MRHQFAHTYRSQKGVFLIHFFVSRARGLNAPADLGVPRRAVLAATRCRGSPRGRSYVKEHL